LKTQSLPGDRSQFKLIIHSGSENSVQM